MTLLQLIYTSETSTSGVSVSSAIHEDYDTAELQVIEIEKTVFEEIGKDYEETLKDKDFPFTEGEFSYSCFTSADSETSEIVIHDHDSTYTITVKPVEIGELVEQELVDRMF